MPETNQPHWEYYSSYGDVDMVTHGGAFVMIDTTGAYRPELVVIERPKGWTLHRICMKKHTFENGVLSDNQLHPSHPAWYAEQCNKEVVAALCSEDIDRMALAYLDLVGYWGAENFDQYPLSLSKEEELKMWCRTRNVPI